MNEKLAIEKIRRQAELLKSDKSLNLTTIVSVTSLFNDLISWWNKWKTGAKEKISE